MPTPSTPDEILDQLVPQLAEVPGVAAVVLGGSRARGIARPDSDTDIGLLYRDDNPIDLSALQSVVDVNDDGLDTTVSPFGGWGPWVNGGAWMKVGGMAVDLLYRSIERYEDTIDKCTRGIVEHDWLQQPPYGFWSHSYLGEIAAAKALHDPTGIVSVLATKVSPYPPLLKANVATAMAFAARFALDNAIKPVERKDLFAARGCITRSVALNVQVLLAMNEVYPVGDKGMIEIVSGLTIAPASWNSSVATALNATDLAEALAAARQLCDDIARL
jgi:predicted nucleotidyltransferase